MWGVRERTGTVTTRTSDKLWGTPELNGASSPWPLGPGHTKPTRTSSDENQQCYHLASAASGPKSCAWTHRLDYCKLNRAFCACVRGVSCLYQQLSIGVDRLSAWPIISADIKHFTDYRYRPFLKTDLPIIIIFFFFYANNILFTGDIIYWWINNTGETI